jgi:MoxR-like ATPase
MQERQITVDGVTHPLPQPFMVLATQNPIEYEGTFPLPEAQLDRFLLRIRVGYPDFDSEVQVLGNQQWRHPLDELDQVADADEVKKMQEAIKEIHVADSMRRYVVELTRQTRQHPEVYLGASMRGSLSLFRASQAKAAMDDRDYVLPDDIKILARVCLPHRVILGPAARLRDITAESVVDEIIDQVPVPGGDLTPEK